MKTQKPLTRTAMPRRKKPMSRDTKQLRRKPLNTKSNGGAAPKPSRSNEPSKKMRVAVLERDDYTCQRCARDIRGRPYSLQHLLPRGRGGKNTMANLVTVCGSATTPGMCHDYIENQQRRKATDEGWLVPNGIDPKTWPVKRFGLDQFQRPGTGWVVVPPHPLQARAAA